jgi:TRAP-type C4-dicarboxylate transport system permease small subunit
MDKIWNAVVAVARFCAWLGGVMLLIAAVLVSTEVISRKLLTYAYSGSDEWAAYLFAVGTSLSLAHVLVTRGHIRIDALYAHLPQWLRPILDIVALIGLGILAYTLVDSGWQLVYENIEEEVRANTPLRTPLAIPQVPWLFGFALFLLAIVLALFRSILALLRGDLATVSQTAGVASQDEEIESELKGLGIRLRRDKVEQQSPLKTSSTEQ